jgi:chromosome segregation ATPase
MLFGGKAKAEEVEQGGLVALLNGSFDRKLGRLGATTREVAGELRTARERFIAACEKFEAIDPEPYTEDLYSVNVNFIRSQKGLYAEALKRLAKELVPEHATKSANAYEECEALASHTGEVMSEILKTNATFRLVVHCYPNYLTDFKRSFSSIERLAGLLKGELVRRSQELAEYRAARESISRLDGYGQELHELEGTIERLKEDRSRRAAGEPDSGHSGIQEMLLEKRKELSRLEAEASGLHHRISLLTAPLDRPAKKFDHLSARKRPLHAFIEDPIGAIRGEADYAEFRELLQKLVEEVNSGKVEVKNREEIGGIASALLGADLPSMIGSFDSLQRMRSDLDGEVRGLERTLDSLREGRNASESAAHRLEDLERRVAETERAREAQKAAVERLFLDNYRRQISIRYGGH